MSGGEILGWLVMMLSLFGTVLNIKRRRECFFIWVFSNAFWMIVDFTHGIYSQSALHCVYFFLAIWGVLEWSKTTKLS